MVFVLKTPLPFTGIRIQLEQTMGKQPLFLYTTIGNYSSANEREIYLILLMAICLLSKIVVKPKSHAMHTIYECLLANTYSTGQNKLYVIYYSVTVPWHNRYRVVIRMQRNVSIQFYKTFSHLYHF